MTAVIVLDVETTGLDRGRDQVIEVCIQLGIEDGVEFRAWRIQPTVPIDPEAQAVHGITMESLLNRPRFPEVAESIVAHIKAADVIVGYNVRFDLEMLQAELDRCGLEMIDLSSKLLVDALRLWQTSEPRSLQDAHRRFVGGEFENAHSAAADVYATSRVLRAMVERFGLDGENWSALAEKGDPLPDRHSWVGPSNHIAWRDDGVPIFTFGKNKGRPLTDARDYCRWVSGQDFPRHVLEICQAAATSNNEQFIRWVAERFPRRAKGAA